tara:strand:- start:122 stop:325 length:204 start_codon:yes stop_codon:yes gene_type:complete
MIVLLIIKVHKTETILTDVNSLKNNEIKNKLLRGKIILFSYVVNGVDLASWILHIMEYILRNLVKMR